MTAAPSGAHFSRWRLNPKRKIAAIGERLERRATSSGHGDGALTNELDAATGSSEARRGRYSLRRARSMSARRPITPRATISTTWKTSFLACVISPP